MPFADERPAFERELDAYYATLPNDVADIRRHVDVENAAHPEWSPLRRKMLLYATIAEKCPVVVWRHFPFYYEVGVGKGRRNLGEGGIGGWLKDQPFGRLLYDAGNTFWRPYGERGLSLGWPVLDDNHHALGMDNVFRAGLSGLAARAEERRKSACDDGEREFLDTMIAGLRAQMRLADRFAEEADRMLGVETDPVVRERLARVSSVARRVPAGPPQTFAEGLAAILFLRETTQALEGNGISILAHVDRMLGPLYAADVAARRLTRDDAKDLLAFFLARSDVLFGMRDATQHVGTNTTVMIGGCDASGAPVFNDVTRLVVECYRDYRLVDPKLNARISAAHPREYFDLLSEYSAQGGNSLSIFNDDVVIPANAKAGKAVEDCRLYAGGGCQENVLENTEINSRATQYMGLPGVFLMGFFPESWSDLAARDGYRVEPYDGAATFDDLYAAFLANLEAVVKAHVAARNRTEGEGARFNPCPLHSASIFDCIENARDMMSGGARYSPGSISLAGMGTLIDSLFAVREVVFERKQVALPALREMLATDFADEEAFRSHVANRIAKFGRDDPEVREFSASVFADVARVARGHRNTRGGTYEASLFAFRSFVDFGRRTGATPDGRRAGEHLSPGMSPSPIALGRECGVTQVLRALEPIDMTDYPVVAVLDLKMPISRTRHDPAVVASVIGCFLDCGGSVLQINVADPAVLVEAREHPDRHPDLVVRISGYSAYFRTLTPAVQDEVIARTLAG